MRRPWPTGGGAKNKQTVSGFQSKRFQPPRTGHEGPGGEYSYSSTLSLISAIDAVGGQHHAPAALPPGKTRHPLCRRLGAPQGRCGWVRKISPTPGFDLRTLRPVASRCIDGAIPAQSRIVGRMYLFNLSKQMDQIFVEDQGCLPGRCVGSDVRSCTVRVLFKVLCSVPCYIIQ
jgi:hypothetical protein